MRLRPEKIALTVYADDFNQFGMRGAVLAVQKDFRDEVYNADLVFADNKWLQETREPTVALGYEICPESGILRADPEELAALSRETRALAKRTRVTRREIASVVGRETKMMLLRRCTLSAWKFVCETQAGKFKITREIAN